MENGDVGANLLKIFFIKGTHDNFFRLYLGQKKKHKGREQGGKVKVN